MTPFPVRLLAAAAVLAAAAFPGGAAEIRALKLGDSLSGTVAAGVEEVVPFDATEGTLLDIDLRMAPASGPAVAVLQPDRTLLPGLPAYSVVDARGAALKVRKIPLSQSGRHFLLVRPSVPGAYTATVKGKPPTKALFSGFVFPDPPSEVTFGAVPGTLLTVTAKELQKSGLSPKILFVRGPGGADVDLSLAAAHVMAPGVDVYRSIPLGELGHYAVGVGTTTGIQGAPGTIQVVLKFPRGKKVKGLDADLVVDPYVDAVEPSSGFDNLAYAGVQLTGDFLRDGATVTLEGPETIAVTGTTRLSDTALTFDVDLAGRTVGGYDVVVAYPNGAAGRLAAGFQVLGTPVPSAILPSSGWDNRTQSFTVNGSRFQSGMSVALRPTAGGSNVSASVGATTATSAAVTLPLTDAPLGTWDVIVTNPDGGTSFLPAAFTVVRGPRFTAASPLLAFDNDAARAVTLGGNYFVAGMACVLEKSGEAPIASVVTGLTASTATATFDLRNRPSGNWTLRVTNPDGGTLTLGTPLAIARAPRPSSTTGARFLDGEPVAGAAVLGTDFVSGAQVSFEIGGGTTFSATNEAVNVPGNLVSFDATASGAATGDHDLRVTNPDGGTALLAAGGVVLGTRTLTTSAASAGRASVAYNPVDGEYLAVYSVFDGSQRDVRAQRFSALTGKPLGSEILVTSGTLDSSTTEDQTAPCVVFSSIAYTDVDPMAVPATGTHHVYLVAYAWKDPLASGNRVRILSQQVNRDGTLVGDQTNAYPIFGAVSGTVDGPRVAWNAKRREWLVAYGNDVSAVPDVKYTCLGSFTSGGVLYLTTVNQGTLIANSHTFTNPQGGTSTALDRSFDADVAWSPVGAGSTDGEFLVAYTLDLTETGGASDTGTDVRARVFAGDFTSGPSQVADLTTLGDVASKNEVRPRVAAGASTYLVGWDYASAAGNRDVRCWLVNSATRAKIGASVTTVEQTSSNDAAFPAIAWDGTAAATGYVVVYPLAPGGSGTSSVVATRLPQSGTAALGTAVHKTLAAAAANAAFDAGDVAGRGTGGEFLAAWIASGSAKAPVDAEVRFAK